MDPRVDNLTVLDDLNENSLLNILRTRFRKDMIYSNIGTILVSVNPFKPLPLYTPQQVGRAGGLRLCGAAGNVFPNGGGGVRLKK